jgi:DNA-binding cell septation regulator SpoVG
MMQITVKKIRLVNSGKPLRGFADLQIGEILIRDFRIIQERGQRAYVASPQISWRDPADGIIKFKTIIKLLSNEMKGAIEVAILSEFQRAREKKNGKPKGRCL